MTSSTLNNHYRRTIIVLTGSVIAVVFINGFIALFGLFYANEKNSQDFQQIESHLKTLESVRAAEVHFKKQVQEWKNILLRGNKKNDFDKYYASFQQQHSTVQSRLQQVIDHRHNINHNQLLLLANTHNALHKKYIKALGSHNLINMDQAREIDATVRGIDRPLTKNLNLLVKTLKQQVDSLRGEMQIAVEQRYQTMRQLITIAISVGLVLILIMSFIVLRKHR